MKTNLIVVAALLFTMIMPAGAQTKYGILNRVGADLNVGTQGIGFDIASPVTSYLEVSTGLYFMPSFKISGDVDVNDINFNYLGNNYNIPMDQVNITGKFARTTGEFKLSAYPFGDRNDLFVSAGFSFAGRNITKLNGHSDDVKAFMDNDAYPDEVKEQVYAAIDKYNVRFDKDGNVKGDIRVNAFRPYFGLGYGRMVPKHRLGFRVELGLQVHGKMKVYQDDKEVLTDDMRGSLDDDISKLVDKLTVYPVLKLSLSGRIL